MGFSSQSGHLIIREQSAANTFPTDLLTEGVAIKTRSGTLEPNRDLMIPDAEIGGGRDVNDAYLGPGSFSGDIEFYARMNSIASMLYGTLGAASSADSGAGSATVSTHTITPVDSTALPWYGVQQAVGNGFEVFNYTDAKFNTFHLEADASGYLMGTAGLVARKQLAGVTLIDPSDPAGDGSDPSLWDETPMIVGTNITVTYNGVTLPAKSFNLDINNNLEDDDFRLGSLFLGDVTEKRREITMGVTIRPADSALWRQAVYGVPGATTLGGVTTKQEAVITVATYEVIGTSIVPFQAVFTVPKAIIKPYGVSPSGDDVIENDLEIQAVRPVAGTPIITAVVKNQRPAIA